MCKNTAGQVIQVGVAPKGIVLFHKRQQPELVVWRQIKNIQFLRKQFLLTKRNPDTNADTMLTYTLETKFACKVRFKLNEEGTAAMELLGMNFTLLTLFRRFSVACLFFPHTLTLSLNPSLSRHCGNRRSSTTRSSVAKRRARSGHRPASSAHRRNRLPSRLRRKWGPPCIRRWRLQRRGPTRRRPRARCAGT